MEQDDDIIGMLFLCFMTFFILGVAFGLFQMSPFNLCPTGRCNWT